MPSEEEPPDTITCPICGYESPEGSTKCNHCYSSLQPGKAEEKPEEEEPEDKELDELMLVPGVGEAKAEILRQAGYRSVKELQTADLEELSSVKGIGERLAAKIIEGAIQLATETGSSPLADWLSGEDAGLNEWLSGEERSQPMAAVARKEIPRDDSLARWLSGQEEDVNTWLEETRNVEPVQQDQIGPHELLAREAELIQLRETFREKLRAFESGQFDPEATIQELAKARGDLEVERTNTRQLEEELENVKRGSIAVIKFIKSQQGSETDQRTITDKLASEMANRENLELKIMQLEEIASVLRDKIESSIMELPPEAQELKRQQMALAEKDAQLRAMKKQLLSKEEALSRGVLIGAIDGAPMVDPELAQRIAESAKREQETNSLVLDLQTKLSEAQMALSQKEEMMKITSGS
ncbi:MAG: hypothetical protein KJ672_00905, partial [Candidatus Thermoplasmatota archaeon]|nr:hypothetical protein [Candidatus Thermoplasmatota archaeon]